MTRVFLKNTFLTFDEQEDKDANIRKASSPSKASSPRSRSVECSSSVGRGSGDGQAHDWQIRKLNEMLAVMPSAPASEADPQELVSPCRDAQPQMASATTPSSASTMADDRSDDLDAPIMADGDHVEFGMNIEENPIDFAAKQGSARKIVGEPQEKPPASPPYARNMEDDCGVPNWRGRTGSSPRSEGASSGGAPSYPQYRHGLVPKTVDFSKGSKKSSDEQPPTTMMIRNIPNRYTQRELIKELEELGFASTFDFLYMPFDKGTMSNVGYSFVNFLDAATAERCKQAFQNYRFKRHCKVSGRVAAISVAHIQGLEANLAHYEKAAVSITKLKQHRPVVMANILHKME